MVIYIQSESRDLRKRFVDGLPSLHARILEVSTVSELMDYLELSSRDQYFRIVVSDVRQSTVSDFVEQIRSLGLVGPCGLVVVASPGQIEAIPLSDFPCEVVLTHDVSEFRLRIWSVYRLLLLSDSLATAYKELRRVPQLDVKLAVADPTIEIPGVAVLLRFLEREWRRCLRYDRPISAIILRPPHGTFQIAADTLSSCIHRPGDLLCRLDGEHLITVLSETAADGVSRVVERVRLTVLEIPDLVGLACGAATVRPLMAYRGMRLGGPADEYPGQEVVEAARRNISTMDIQPLA